MDKISYKKSAIVWAISSLVFFIYGLCFVFNIIDVEGIISYIQAIPPKYIYISAFITIFIESIYIIGTFFPGSSLVAFLAMIAAINSISSFLLVILSIFLGWVLSSVVNISIGKLGANKNIQHNHIKENYYISWYPAFRATEEVAQTSCGVKPIKVFISSFKIKLVTSLIMMLITFTLSTVIDLNKISSREGYISVFLACFICLLVTYYKFKSYKKLEK